MKKFLIMLCLAAATVMSAAAQEKFPMITIPEDVTDPLLRAKYLSDHFWENVDFETASLLRPHVCRARSVPVLRKP